MVVSTLINSFSQEEWQQFGKFIKSRSKSQKIIVLWKEFNKAFPNIDSISKADLVKKLKIKESYLNKLLSEFRQLIDTFFIHQNEEELDIILLKNYQARGLHHLVEKKLSTIKKQLTATHYTSNHPLYLYTFITETVTYKHLQEQSKSKRSNKTNIESLLHSLDIFYVVEKLRYSLYAYTLNSLYNISIDSQEIDYLLRFAHQDKFQSIPEITLFKKLIELYTLEAEGDFELFLSTIEHHKRNIGQELLEEMYILGCNYCNKQYAKGKHHYLPLIFSLYQKMRSDDLMYLHSPSFFIHLYPNMAIAASKLQEYEWAISFTEEYKSFLLEEVREGLYKMNLAIIAFYNKDYHKAIQYASQIPKMDAFYHINQEMLIIKALYFLNDIDELELKIDTFLSYIFYKEQECKREQIAPFRVIAYKNFLNIMKRVNNVLKNKLNPNYKTEHALVILDNIKNDVEQNSMVIDKKWLIKQLDALSHSFRKEENAKQRMPLMASDA